MFLPLILVMILFSVFGQRKERKKREALLSSVKKHDRIRTIGGVIGSVVELNDDTVVLKVDESSNTRMTLCKVLRRDTATSQAGRVGCMPARNKASDA